MVSEAAAWAKAQAAGYGQGFAASLANAYLQGTGLSLSDAINLYYQMNPQLTRGAGGQADTFYNSGAADAQAQKILGTPPETESLMTYMGNYNLGEDYSNKSTIEKELNLLKPTNNLQSYSPTQYAQLVNQAVQQSSVTGVPVSKILNSYLSQTYAPANTYNASNLYGFAPSGSNDLINILTGNTTNTLGGYGYPASTKVVSEGGYDFLIGYDANGKEVSRELIGQTQSTGMTDYQKAQIGLAQEEYKQNLINAQNNYNLQLEQLRQNSKATEYDYSLALKKYEQSVKEAEQAFTIKQRELGISEAQLALDKEYQTAQIALEKEKFAWEQTQANAQLDLENRAYAANLAANPKSWLEYAAFTGNVPAIQPWMQPLMPQQYSNLTAGSAIPGIYNTQMPTGMTGIGINPDGTTTVMNGSPVSAFDYSNLPQLTTPSRQYQARMNPSSFQQYTGYEQARTGMTPEDLEYRLWSQAAPGGNYQGLSYGR